MEWTTLSPLIKLFHNACEDVMNSATIVIDEIKDKIVTSMWDEAYSNPIQVPIGPVVTRARVKKFKEALNGLIKATWAQSNS